MTTEDKLTTTDCNAVSDTTVDVQTSAGRNNNIRIHVHGTFGDDDDVTSVMSGISLVSGVSGPPSSVLRKSGKYSSNFYNTGGANANKKLEISDALGDTESSISQRIEESMMYHKLAIKGSCRTGRFDEDDDDAVSELSFGRHWSTNDSTASGIAQQRSQDFFYRSNRATKPGGPEVDQDDDDDLSSKIGSLSLSGTTVGNNYPKKGEIVAGGIILSRCSASSLLLRRWKADTYWCRHGPSTILVFRCQTDFERWREVFLYIREQQKGGDGETGKKRHHEYTDDEMKLIKKVIDFDTAGAIKRANRDASAAHMGSSGAPPLIRVIKYGIMQIKVKAYKFQGAPLYNFKVDQWTDAGPGTAAAFASKAPGDVQDLRDSMINCMDYCSRKYARKKEKRKKKKLKQKSQRKASSYRKQGSAASSLLSGCDVDGQSSVMSGSSFCNGSRLREQHLQSMESGNDENIVSVGPHHLGVNSSHRRFRSGSLVSGVSSLSNVSSHIGRRSYAVRKRMLV